MTTVRAAVYVRISKDREGAGLGVATQEADCRELADRLGWTIVSTHCDNDFSAYSGKPRPGYRELLDQIRAGSIDAVLAWHTDRLHRSPAELEAYVAICEAYGVTTHTVKAGPLDLSTPSGRLIARQLGSLARYESEHQVERVQRAKLRSATNGVWLGGQRPFGFAADGVAVLEREAELLRQATTDFLAGASLTGLASGWNRRGVTTTRGKPWTSISVRRVLARPRNCGLMQHRDQVVGIAQWEPIIPEDQWRAVVGLLGDPSRRTTPGPTPKWLMSGIATCGKCGGKVRASRANGHMGKAEYRCARGCGNRVAEDLDHYIRTLIAERLRMPDAADLLVHADNPEKATKLRAEALALNARLDELATMFGDGLVTGRQLSEGSERIRTRLRDVESAQTASAKANALDGVLSASDPGGAFLGLGLDRQRAVIKVLLDRVELLPGFGGRPRGWVKGQPYFRPESVNLVWQAFP